MSNPGVEVIAEAADGSEAIELARAHRPDVVFLDEPMSGLDPLGAAAVVLAATAVGWLGAWLVTGHFLRQTRPTDT